MDSKKRAQIQGYLNRAILDDMATVERQVRRRGGAGARRYHLDHVDVVSAHVSGCNQPVESGRHRDPATDTYASPDLWANFADFYRRAATASKLAQDASTTKRLDEFKRLIGELRTACNGCHEKYMKTN